MRTRAAVCAALLSVTLGSQGSLAADQQGNFATRGVGSQSCQPYIDAVTNNNSEQLRVYLAWIDGVLSATNRLKPNTYDSSPFVAPGAFAGLVLNACRRNPAALFDTAVSTVVTALDPLRVQRNSPLVQMQVGEAATSLREETLRAVQGRLRALNLMRVAPTGTFTEPTREALIQFQAQQNLARTGLPDPDTVIRLLGSAPPAAPQPPAAGQNQGRAPR